MPGYLNDVDGVDPSEDSGVGEKVGNRIPLDTTGVRFTLQVADCVQTYGPYPDRDTFIFAFAFAVGWAAGHGFANDEIDVRFEQ